MMLADQSRAFLGHVLQAPAPGKLESIAEALLCVDVPSGAISSVLTPEHDSYQATLESHARTKALYRCPSGTYLLPGFVDLHIHATQWPQVGCGLDLPLKDWLEQRTFPLEARFAAPDFARPIYDGMLRTLVANGTTTAVYFAGQSLASYTTLMDACVEKGQRAFIGRVAMDKRDQCPENYRDPSAAEGLLLTEASLEYAKNAGPLVHPVVTPRFVPTCSDELLRGLGDLAARHDCHVQTHCSESDWEHNHVVERFNATDTSVLEDFGLLTRKTVLAHAPFITDDDAARIQQCGASVVHCPLSNLYFANAILRARELLSTGVNVGLATDIAGGPTPSLLENCAAAIGLSQALEDGVDARQAASVRGYGSARFGYCTSFWMATTAGGIALDTNIGLLRPGYQFDAVLVDGGSPDSNLSIDADTEPGDALQKIIYTARRDATDTVWVSGKKVHGRTTH